MKLVLVGNGLAGMRCLEDLLDMAPDRYEVTVIGEEPWETTTVLCYRQFCQEIKPLTTSCCIHMHGIATKGSVSLRVICGTYRPSLVKQVYTEKVKWSIMIV